ncbi:hypothetical protein HDU67_002491 [Dinochytrium kinnereticum]|nr:hypothetical protein HDU67_002491 [Dinochytrium kinnereticum]
MQPRTLTIAGSDSGGGAGIQADLKTFMAFSVHGSSCITAITAQNTVGVQDIAPLNPSIIKGQITSVLSDIGADCIKIGMLFSSDIINAVAESLDEHSSIPVVIDPVMVATSQSRPLLSPDAIDTFKSRLLPKAFILTPNVPEAEVLTGTRLHTLDDMRVAAEMLSKAGSKYVLVKGGHLPFASQPNGTSGDQEADLEIIDLFYDGTTFTEIRNPYIRSKNTHGTGCTLSAAIASCIARGMSPLESVVEGIHYVRSGMKHGFSLGQGHGPINHFFHIPKLQFSSQARFIDHCIEKDPVSWRKYQFHPFVERVADGSLPLDTFRHFLRQDFLFLK